MAAYLSQQVVLPDVILCSSAQRTRETLAYLMRAYAHEMQVSLDRNLYLASSLAMLEKVKNVPDTADTVMVVAHNPGTEELANMLAGQGDDDLLNEMSFKYPTGACAHISFNVDRWSEIRSLSGKLENYTKPRDLLAGE